MRQIFDLSDHWKFREGDPPGAAVPDFDDQDWDLVRVPHDWAICRPLIQRQADVHLSVEKLNPDPRFTYASAQGFYDRWGIGWYRRRLDFSLSAEQVAWLDFDGIYQESTIYLDGRLIGGRPYGYAPFACPAEPGALAIRVDNSPEHGADRWYSGCGIIRPVRLLVCDRLHVSRQGIVLTTSTVDERQALVHLSVNIRNDFLQDMPTEVQISLLSPQGSCCAGQLRMAMISAGRESCLTADLSVADPQLWAPDSPALYTCRIALIRDGRMVDQVDERFGIRTVEFRANQGLFLNGQPIKIKGVNLHHDLGAVGAAWHPALARDRLATLKSLGCNAVRTSHNPPAAQFLDLCDELGFLVVDEAFDKWDTLSYGPIFESCWQQDLDAMIDRDRNHPCVILWSVGNEVNHQGKPDMIGRLARLAGRVRQKDPSRPVTFAMEPHCFDPEQARLTPLEKAALVREMLQHVDIIGANYQEQWYDAYHKMMPDALILGTETFPFFRGSGNSHAGMLPQNPWLDCLKPYVIGQFIWVGIDYLGEAVGGSGWPVRGWTAGLLDTAGQVKPKAHLTRSFWQTEPMVHLVICDDTLRNPMEPTVWSNPKWAEGWNFDHLGTAAVRLDVFTNCDSIEIRLNGRTIQSRDQAEFPGGFLECFVPWQPGKIQAIGFRQGQEVCRQEYCTAGDPHHISLTGRFLGADGEKPVLRIDAQALDIQEIPCRHYEAGLTFACSESLELLGVDNGDLTDHTPYLEPVREMRQGRCTAFYRVCDHPGAATVAVRSADGLEGFVEI